MSSTDNDGRHDFDFFHGTWKFHNRKLEERLAGSDTWLEFDGYLACKEILGGLGNIDDGILETDAELIHCLTLRLFNPQTREWSLYWSDSRHGVLVPPMIGKFENGRGEFFAHETHKDQYIFSRFIWSNITETSCHWEQAFSADGGKSWETNWTMDFIRQV